jgi:signal transduction histidine kinase
MGEEIRKLGIDIIDEAPWGTHFCQFFKTKEDLIDILVPYFRAGLENNEFCIWVTSEPLGVEDAKRSLKRVVKNLDDYVERGQIEIIDYSQWYTKSGEFQPEEVLGDWIQKEKQALKKGFDGLRLTGNTFWLEKKDWKKFTDYEAAVDNVIGQYRMIAMCTYSLDKCGVSEVMDVINNHEFVITMKEGKWTIVENIERKRLKEVMKSHKQLRGFATHLGLLREKEKKLLAEEIHDDVAQVLVGLKINLSLLSKEVPTEQKILIEKIRCMTDLTDKALQKAKKMYTELRPSVLNHLGLGSAIKWQAEEFQEQTGIKCEVTIYPKKIALDWERSTLAFRIFQEALVNVAHHSDATKVKVKLSVIKSELKLVVKDNGKGIADKQLTSPKSYGIMEMRERVGFLEGTLDIKGVQNKGTRLSVRIPLSR